MKSINRTNIISLITYKHSMLTKITAWMLIFCFSMTSVVCGADKSDFDHLRQIRTLENEGGKDIVEARLGPGIMHIGSVNDTSIWAKRAAALLLLVLIPGCSTANGGVAISIGLVTGGIVVGVAAAVLLWLVFGKSSLPYSFRRKVLEVLIKHGKSPGARIGIINKLGAMGQHAAKSVPVLVQLLMIDSTDLQLAIMNAVAKTEAVNSEYINTLKGFLRDADKRKREASFNELDRQGALTPELMMDRYMVDLSYEPTRLAAVKAIGDLGAYATPAIPTLTGFLEQNQPLRQAAFEALDEIGVLTADQKAHKYILDIKDCVARDAVERLVEIGKIAVPYLIEALSDSKAEYSVILTLGRIGPDAADAVPAIVENLKKCKKSNLDAIANTLANIGPVATSANTELKRHLYDPRYNLPRQKVLTALEVLGGLSDEEKTQAYIRGLHAVRCEPYVAKVASMKRNAVQPLINVLSESRSARETKLGAIRALKMIGEDAKEAIPALERIAVATTYQLHAFDAIVSIEGSLNALDIVGRINPKFEYRKRYFRVNESFRRAIENTTNIELLINVVYYDRALPEVAIARLGAIGGNEAIAHLCVMFSDTELFFRSRCAAAKAVARLGEEAVQAKKHFIAGLVDEKAEVRDAACLALDGMGALTPAYKVKKLIIDFADSRLRKSAVESLMELGDAAKDAGSELREYIRILIRNYPKSADVARAIEVDNFLNSIGIISGLRDELEKTKQRVEEEEERFRQKCSQEYEEPYDESEDYCGWSEVREEKEQQEVDSRMQEIFEEEGLERGYLHGSRAKGTSGPRSDWDYSFKGEKYRTVEESRQDDRIARVEQRAQDELGIDVDLTFDTEEGIERKGGDTTDHRTSTAQSQIVDSPELSINESTKLQVEEDLGVLVRLIEGEYLDSEFFEGIRLHIQVDKDRMYEGAPEYDIARLWLGILEKRSGGAITGRIVQNGKHGNGLIRIIATRDHRSQEMGECAINVAGRIETIPRLFGILNMAFAGSLIPNDIDALSESLPDYTYLVDFIENQHFLLTGESYLKEDLKRFKDGTIEDMQDVIYNRLRLMMIDLPPAEKMKYDNYIAREVLTAV